MFGREKGKIREMSENDNIVNSEIGAGDNTTPEISSEQTKQHVNAQVNVQHNTIPEGNIIHSI